MNAEDRAAAQARCEAATEGPWVAASNNRRKDGIALVAADSEGISAPVAVLAGARFTIKRRHANAEFIAHARTDLPAALAALESVEQERDALKAENAAMKATEMRPLTDDFYLDPRGQWVYRWSDKRLVLVSVGEGTGHEPRN